MNSVQCRPGLICWKDTTPACCEKQTHTNIEGVTSFCAADSCNRANEEVDLCFSGATKVQVLMNTGEELIKTMAELEVGDSVLSANGAYQTVYAFAHIDRTRPTRFHQFFTDTGSSEAALEVTENHLIFVEGKSHPVPARRVRAGDILKGIQSQQYQATLNVTSINTILREGLYAPLTNDGTLVVGNEKVVASNYIFLQESENLIAKDGHVQLRSIGTVSWLHHADMSHMWLSPLRLVCTLEQSGKPNHPLLRGMLPSSICTSRSTDDGLLEYVSVGLKLTHFMDQQPLWAQLTILIPVLILLSLCMAAENLILEGRVSSWLLAALALLLSYRYHQCRQQRKSRLSR